MNRFATVIKAHLIDFMLLGFTLVFIFGLFGGYPAIMRDESEDTLDVQFVTQCSASPVRTRNADKVSEGTSQAQQTVSVLALNADKVSGGITQARVSQLVTVLVVPNKDEIPIANYPNICVQDITFADDKPSTISLEVTSSQRDTILRALQKEDQILYLTFQSDVAIPTPNPTPTPTPNIYVAFNLEPDLVTKANELTSGDKIFVLIVKANRDADKNILNYDAKRFEASYCGNLEGGLCVKLPYVPEETLNTFASHLAGATSIYIYPQPTPTSTPIAN